VRRGKGRVGARIQNDAHSVFRARIRRGCTDARVARDRDVAARWTLQSRYAERMSQTGASGAPSRTLRHSGYVKRLRNFHFGCEKHQANGAGDSDCRNREPNPA
jgi:hypothetical protein